MQSARRSLTTPARGAALLAAVAVGAAGCSSKKSFEVSELCGRKVDASLVAPFLPEGETLKVDDGISAPGQPRCQVYVDGDLHLYVRGNIDKADFDILKATERSMRRLGNPAPARGIGDGATIADRGAMAVQACTYKGEESQYILEIDWVDTPKNTAERREALEKLLRAHLPVIMEAEGCRP
ncbi:hypothetical protein YW5DRAFT_04991 [Streptomyces sp. Ncost-T6T-1]|uniref:hypothetical protein n=1 Tax=Streptomyces sp. Ncost-T6T-1 TaxID=1100828 RepID=UPI0008050555|nr:hypothetical protein [Streptomyces sp. Ncost-T6T-1]SBU95040.1 hypothetical protein YW5DRAFT_04991 [Streptomyces sp. Ncost-T6T-1]